MIQKKLVCLVSDIKDGERPTPIILDGVIHWFFHHSGVIKAYLKCGHGKSLKRATVCDNEIFCCQPYDYESGEYKGSDAYCSNLVCCNIEVVGNQVYILTDVPPQQPIVNA